MLRPDRVACPSPPRAFTSELSPPKSPQRGVEYDYAGKTVNSRDRTFTGKISSLMGCGQPDWSIVDLWVARELLCQGASPFYVCTLLQLGSPHFPRRHGDPQDYLRRTLLR